MPLWLLTAVQAAALALVKPMVELLIKAIFDINALTKLFVSCMDRLVSVTSTELDNAWWDEVKKILLAELEKRQNK